jgi:quercetin dioxygenase-like cupin family protein
MNLLDPKSAAWCAVASSPTRPATAIPDVRLIVFRIEPGQSVAPHHNASTVLLTVLEGSGLLAGRDGEVRCGVGDVVAYEPGETHGMRALDEPLHLLATIAPRPGDKGRT